MSASSPERDSGRGGVLGYGHIFHTSADTPTGTYIQELGTTLPTMPIHVGIVWLKEPILSEAVQTVAGGIAQLWR